MTRLLPPATALALLLGSTASAQTLLSPALAPAPRLPAVIHPSAPPDDGGAEATQDRAGAYWFDVRVNGSTVPMVFDSGAAVVVLRSEDAARIGLDVASPSSPAP